MLLICFIVYFYLIIMNILNGDQRPLQNGSVSFRYINEGKPEIQFNKIDRLGKLKKQRYEF
jgi:hypothetical protein